MPPLLFFNFPKRFGVLPGNTGNGLTFPCWVGWCRHWCVCWRAGCCRVWRRCVRVRMLVLVYVCVCVCVGVGMCAGVCAECVYVCMYVCVLVCVYVSCVCYDLVSCVCYDSVRMYDIMYDMIRYVRNTIRFRVADLCALCGIIVYDYV